MKTLIGLIAAGLVSLGCVGTAGADTVIEVVTPQEQVQQVVIVEVVPPPPIVEVIPVRPSPRHTYRTGYWHWNGVKYVWFGGRWYYRPYHRWVAPHYIRVGGRIRFHAGFWVRR